VARRPARCQPISQDARRQRNERVEAALRPHRRLTYRI
jgi:hypothetical protein